MTKQIPVLNELTQADADDLLLIRDVDAGVDKKISYQNAIQVQSVAGKQGAVTLDFDDIGGSIDNGQVPQSTVTQHQSALAIPFSQLTGSIANGQVPQSAVTQHQSALAIPFSQLTGSIGDGQVPSSAVTQHATALNNAASSNVIQVQSAIKAPTSTYNPGTVTVELTITVTPKRADSYLLVEFDDLLAILTNGSPSSHAVLAELRTSASGGQTISHQRRNRLTNTPAEIPVRLVAIRPSSSTDPVTFSVRYTVPSQTQLVRSTGVSGGFTPYVMFKVTELLLAQFKLMDT